MTLNRHQENIATRFAFASLGLLVCAVLSSVTLAKDQLTRISALDDKNKSVAERVPHPVVHLPGDWPVVHLPEDWDDMVGQMVMVGFHGTTKSSKNVQKIAKLIRDGTIGGVILMARNVRNKKQLRKLAGIFRAARPELPPFIAIDQEGGAVQRLTRRRGFRRTPGAAYIVRKKSLDQAREIYGKMAREMADVGINMNFGPVVDLATNKRNPIITRRGRSYGKDPKQVADFASAFIEAHRNHGVLSVAKHFPGHGSSWTDSHRRFVDLSKTWKPVELEPYRLLAERNAPDFVMVGHLFHPKYGGESRLPASLSKLAIENELRDTLKFKGLVITDDLEMRSVKQRFKYNDLAIRAVNAGNDIVLFSNATMEHHTPETVHRSIREAVYSGKISRDRIRASYKRIKKLKYDMMRRARSARLGQY